MTFEGIDVEKEIADIAKDLERTDTAITKAVNYSKELLSKIMKAGGKSVECDVLYSRYEALKSQYTADIKRLTFIVNGEVEMRSLPQNTECPFCDGKISVSNRKSYMGTARAELARIVSQLNGLSETESDVLKQKTDIQEELATLQAQRADVETLINKKLKPKADELTQSLNNYREYIKLQNEVDIIKNFSDRWTTDLRNLSTEDTNRLEYRPKEYFDDAFLETMDQYAMSILSECNYENLTSARFNLQDFDIEVNGGKKERNKPWQRLYQL